MIIYCLRSGEIGFAPHRAPTGATPLAHAPHGIAELAVASTAQFSVAAWVVPDMAAALVCGGAKALYLRLDYESDLRRRIAQLKDERSSRSIARLRPAVTA